jgi:3-deoxy-D-manno-octulosonic-acid transferase
VKRKFFLLALAAYSVAVSFASVLLLPWLVVAAVRGRSQHFLPSRLGRIPRGTFGGQGHVWFHAVSVGEAAAAVPMVHSLLKEGPVAVSTGTPAGMASLDRWLDERVDRFYLPLDFPPALDRLFRVMRPRALAIVETELWPGLIATAARRGVPVLLVNAKIPPADFPRYRATRAFWRPILGRCRAILAASGAERDRFVQCGARPALVTVAGDSKYDAALRASGGAACARLAPLFAGRPPDRPLVVLASTHRGEEDLLLGALRRVSSRAQVVVAPRHLQRARAAAAALERRGLTFERRSAGTLAWTRDAVLWDTMGELAALYAFADIVVMGGSWAPCGGHNPIEPAAWAKPVVVGPHMENFREILADFAERQALVATPFDGLAEALRRLVDDPAYRAELGRRARACVEAHAGAVDACVTALRGAWLPRPTGPLALGVDEVVIHKPRKAWSLEIRRRERAGAAPIVVKCVPAAAPPRWRPFLRRFLSREAALLKALETAAPGVAPRCVRAGRDAVELEFLGGRTLYALRSSLAGREDVFASLAAATATLHAAGYAHGEVRLGNALWDGRRVHLVDFATAVGPTSRLLPFVRFLDRCGILWLKRHVFRLPLNDEDRRFRRRHAMAVAAFDFLLGYNAKYC